MKTTALILAACTTGCATAKLPSFAVCTEGRNCQVFISGGAAMPDAAASAAK